MTEPLRLFVACAPGLEPLVADELRDLDLEVERSLAGGIELVGDSGVLYRVLLGCGLGLRVLVRIAGFSAREFARLERELDRIEWSRWIRPGEAIEVRASARRSRLYHTGALVERVELAIGRQLAIGDGEAGTGVYLRNEGDRVEVSIDACGAALHKRGWRVESGKAPLREDIARGLLRLVGFEGDWALLDPVAGAGTLVIEAATIAAGLAPGGGREFACMRWPDFDAEAFERERGRFGGSASAASGPIRLFGRDRNEGAVAIATANAARAGVGERVGFEARSLGDRTLPDELRSFPGHVALIGNPPWGQRVGDVARLRNLYASFGQLARALARDRPIAIGLVTPDRMLAGATGLGLTAKVWTDQGGTRIGLWTGELEARAQRA